MQAPEVWGVCFGNSFCNEERCVAVAYDSGLIRLFDLRMNSLRWEGVMPEGVCSVQFDRVNVPMNKLLAAGLNGQQHVFDMRTQHPVQVRSCLPSY